MKRKRSTHDQGTSRTTTTTMTDKAILRGRLFMASLFLLVLHATTVKAQPCVFCKYGVEGNENYDTTSSLILRDKPLEDLVGIAETCGDLYDWTISQSLEVSDMECGLVQSISTICGCPTRDTPCSLCGSLTALADDASAIQVALPDNLALAIGLFTGTAKSTASCALVQAYTQSHKDGSNTCTSLQSDYGAGCHCLDSETTTTPGSDNNSNTTTLGGDDDDDNEEGFCALCSRIPGFRTPVPDRDLSRVYQGLSVSEQAHWQRYVTNQTTGTTDTINFTCGTLESFLETFPPDHDMCKTEWMKIVRGLCECPPRNDMCTVCANSTMANPDQSIGDLLSKFMDMDMDLTCADMQLVVTQYRHDGGVCNAVELYHHVCACRGVDGTIVQASYMGAHTTRQKQWLAWLPRVSASISLLGSSSILVYFWRNAQSRNKLYPQLVAGMSVGDLFLSIGWILSTWPEPVTQYGLPTGIYGAKGNDATCTMQGFLLELGLTGMYYNLSLCVYYFLAVVYGMRDSQMNGWMFHVPPVVVGLALALAGLPHYTQLFLVCHISPEPFAESQTIANVFVVIPIATTMVICTGCLVLIYYYVWKQDQVANRWRFGGRSETVQSRPQNRLSTAVSYQATLYMLSFSLSYPIYFWALYRFQELRDNYTFWIVLVCLNPLQGLWNAIIFFRTNLAERCSRASVRLTQTWRTASMAVRQRLGTNSGESQSAVFKNEPSRSAETSPEQPRLIAESVENIQETQGNEEEPC